jgi:hypothetical protein
VVGVEHGRGTGTKNNRPAAGTFFRFAAANADCTTKSSFTNTARYINISTLPLLVACTVPCDNDNVTASFSCLSDLAAGRARYEKDLGASA